jgi:hypothetical protein
MLKKIAIALAILLVIAFIAGVIVYIIGARLPVNHKTSVTGTVEASPARVFAIITDVADGAAWRKQVKAVKVLPPDQGRDRWIEDLGHGQTMSFLALQSNPPDASEHALRVVQLADPKAQYGGTWTYEIVPGPSPDQTILQITEEGFIHPPIYRFMMHNILGMTANLDQYMHDIQAAAKRT